MAFKRISAGMACVVAFTLFSAWFLFRRTDAPSHTTRQIIVINKLLFKLRKECITGQIDVAQNTIEDVKQEWEYLNVMGGSRITFPFDSLHTLDSLVMLMLNRESSKRLLPVVLSEINAVNSALDKLH